MRRAWILLIAAGAALLLAPATTAQPADDRDCADFGSQEEAQEFFENAGPGDPHGLDSDDDGIACETVAQQGGSPSPVATAAPTAAPTASPSTGNNTLPNNGGPEAIFGISGLSLLGTGVGLRTLHRRMLPPPPAAHMPQMLVYRAVIDRASREY